MYQQRNGTTYRQVSTWHAVPSQHTVSPQHKVILLGTVGVGKTAFFLRIRDDVFRQPEATCYPADYLIKTICVPNATKTDVTPIKVCILATIITDYIIVSMTTDHSV